MNKNNYVITDHLGDDFENQKLVERKKRLDAQIDEYTRLYALNDLSKYEVSLIQSTLVYLLELQRSYSSRIKLIKAICLN